MWLLELGKGFHPMCPQFKSDVHVEAGLSEIASACTIWHKQLSIHHYSHMNAAIHVNI